MSRIAYYLESSLLAAALLTPVSFHWLLLGTVAGFLAPDPSLCRRRWSTL